MPLVGTNHRWISAGIALLAMILMSSSGATADDSPSSEEMLIAELRNGGYTLYFRHEATNWAQSDDVRKQGDWLSCDNNRMRQLSSAGRERAAETGRAIRSLGIPIGKVLASPYCRTMNTARLMDIGPVEAARDVINLRVAEYFGGRDQVISTAQALIAQPPESGTNTLIVAHGNVAREATRVYPAEGEGIVFLADSREGFRYIGQLTAQAWSRIAAAGLR